MLGVLSIMYEKCNQDNYEFAIIKNLATKTNPIAYPEFFTAVAGPRAAIWQEIK